jgi:hypothetical protein
MRHIGKGNKTSPCLILEHLEKSRDSDRIASQGQLGRQGLGFRRIYRKVEPRADLIDRMKKEAEERRLLILHNYQLQAAWLSWGLDNMMRSDLTWTYLLYGYSDRLLKFMVNSQANTCPSPDNLRRWKLTNNAACGLCGQTAATLSHILAGCGWVRNAENKLPREDRYTWRHNNILSYLAKVIKEQIAVVNAYPKQKTGEPLIRFVRAGEAAKKAPSKLGGILAKARDWVCHFDLPELRLPASAYVFPQDVCLTPLKMDGHLISRDKRICVGIELTAPMEHNIATWHTAKLNKYENEGKAQQIRKRTTN